MILVFSSFDVGGHPFRIAEVLQRNGLPALFLSLSPAEAGHDSRAFHSQGAAPPWDLSGKAPERGAPRRALAGFLADLRATHGITCCFATGRRSHLLAGAGLPYHYWSYGSDLDQECFGPAWPRDFPAWRRPWAIARHAVMDGREARRSLRRAAAVMIAAYQAPALARVAPGKPLFFLPHLLASRPEQVLAEERARARAAICASIGADRFFFCSARHVWSRHYRGWPDNKGNDKLLEAFAILAASGAAVGTKLVLVDKGPDVAASRSLAARLGIAERIAWIPEMPRRGLEPYYLGASLCFGQFGNRVVTYAALEPLAVGTPCVTALPEGAAGVPWYHTPPPLFGATGPKEIARIVMRLVWDDLALTEAGARSRRWVREQCSEAAFCEAFRGLLPAP